MAEANLQLFLLGAERLLRCRWDGRTENLEILNSAMDGETVREVAQIRSIQINSTPRR